jgi:hypothetical protein
MGWGRVLPIMVILSVIAAAQTPPPWQQQPQQSQGTPAWPQPGQAAAPGAPMVPMGPAGASQPPCFAEFLRLRSEVEKQGVAAKAANERHVQREEFCKLITALSVASSKWAKFTVSKGKDCGIPPDAVAQIKGQDEHLAGLKKQACSLGQRPTLMRIARDPSPD